MKTQPIVITNLLELIKEIEQDEKNPITEALDPIIVDYLKVIKEYKTYILMDLNPAQKNLIALRFSSEGPLKQLMLHGVMLRTETPTFIERQCQNSIFTLIKQTDNYLNLIDKYPVTTKEKLSKEADMQISEITESVKKHRILLNNLIKHDEINRLKEPEQNKRG